MEYRATYYFDLSEPTDPKEVVAVGASSVTRAATPEDDKVAAGHRDPLARTAEHIVTAYGPALHALADS
jgi:hypothetical protein